MRAPFSPHVNDRVRGSDALLLQRGQPCRPYGNALIEETRTAPGEELGSIEMLIDAVMADLLLGGDDDHL